MSTQSPPQNGADPHPAAQRGRVEVAHQDLIRRWPQVQRWVSANRVALLIRQEVAEAADDWIAAGEDPLNDDLLVHRGPQLDLAETLPKTLGHGFNGQERRYLDACQGQRTRSIAEAERQRRREIDIRTRWLKFVGVFAALAMIFALVSSILYLDQQRQLRANLAQDLAAKAMTEYGNGRYELAALLARQAYLFDDGHAPAQVANALQLTAGSPYFSTLTGDQHSWINGLTFSPDGTHLASASADRSIGLLEPGRPTTPQVVLGTHGSSATAVAFHPHSRRNLLASAGLDGMVRLWSGTSGAAIGPPIAGPGGEITSLAFDGGTSLAVGSCTAWDGSIPTGTTKPAGCRDGGAVVRILTITDAVQASAAPGATWHAPQHRDLAIGARHVCGVAFSRDGRWLAAGGCKGMPEELGNCTAGSGPLELWDLSSPDRPPICLNGHQGDIWALAFSPDGTELASGGSDATVRLWELARITPDSTTLGASASLQGHNEDIRSLAFSTDGDLLATGSHDGSVGLWDLASAGQPTLFRLGSTTEWVRAVAFGGPSGRVLAAANAGGKIRLWDLTASAVAPSVLRGHTDYVRALAYAPQGEGSAAPLASASNDGTVRLWRFDEQENSVDSVVLPMSGPGAPGTPSVNVSSVSFSRDGHRLAAASEDGIVRVWDHLTTDPQPTIYADHASGPTVVAFSPSGDYLASVGSTGDIFLWGGPGHQIGAALCLSDAPEGEPDDCTRRKDPPAILAFSPGGTMLAAGDTTGRIRVWSLSDGPTHPTEIATFSAERKVTALGFSPKDGLLAVGGADGVTLIWSAVVKAVVEELKGHDGEVRSVAFSPDGSQLATGGNDQVLMLRDTGDWDGAPTTIRDLSEWIRALTFSPDGSTLAAVSTQGMIRLIVAHSDAVADRTCQRVSRNLSPDEWVQFVGEDELTPFAWLFQEDPSEFREICPGLPIEPERTSEGPGMIAMAMAGISTFRGPSRRRGATGTSRGTTVYAGPDVSLRGSRFTGPGVRSVGTRWESQPPIVSAAVRRRPIGPECWATISA